MEFLIVLLVIAIIIGAIFGGKSFGGTVRIGCGFIIMIVIIIAVLGAVIYAVSEYNDASNNTEAVSSSPTYFIVKQDCQTYTKPDIESDISGQLEKGEEILVKNANKFKYFYEVTDEIGKTSYVRKECLKIK
jgi:uncharacterized protein YpmB